MAKQVQMVRLQYFKQQQQQLWNVATMYWIKGSDQMYQIDA